MLYPWIYCKSCLSHPILISIQNYSGNGERPGRKGVPSFIFYLIHTEFLYWIKIKCNRYHVLVLYHGPIYHRSEICVLCTVLKLGLSPCTKFVYFGSVWPNDQLIFTRWFPDSFNGIETSANISVGDLVAF